MMIHPLQNSSNIAVLYLMSYRMNCTNVWAMDVNIFSVIQCGSVAFPCQVLAAIVISDMNGIRFLRIYVPFG